MNDFGHWRLADGLAVPDTLPYGFVYLITHAPTGKKYIGKKQMQRTVRLPPLKGKSRRRTVIKETDWKTYTSSCHEILTDIQENGTDSYDFTILRWCTCKWELAYYEMEEQVHRRVLWSDDYFNRIINVRIGPAPHHSKNEMDEEKKE